jgi:hypothetical protein
MSCGLPEMMPPAKVVYGNQTLPSGLLTGLGILKIPLEGLSSTRLGQ